MSDKPEPPSPDSEPKDSRNCKSAAELLGWSIRKVGEKHNDPQMLQAANWLLDQLREQHSQSEQKRPHERYRNAIEAAISQASAMRERVTVEAEDGAEAYAYPHPRGIAYGLNAAGSGVNILRGVRRPNGADEAMS